MPRCMDMDIVEFKSLDERPIQECCIEWTSVLVIISTHSLKVLSMSKIKRAVLMVSYLVSPTKHSGLPFVRHSQNGFCRHLRPRKLRSHNGTSNPIKNEIFHFSLNLCGNIL